MLKLSFTQDGQHFNCSFDVPLPGKLAAHPEIAPVLGRLWSNNEQSVMESGGCIAGGKGTTADLITLLRTFLRPADFAAQESLIEHAAACRQPQQEGLQVNFHQQSFDTPERYWRFILNQGSFSDYFVNRVNWYLAPLTRYVTDFPLHVDLESASTCNMNCPMCYRSEMESTGRIDEELFCRLIDECAAHNLYSVRLSWRGETLTHPRIKELIEYACRRIKNVSFLTNAFYLTEDMADCFIACGVSYLAVSFDGIGRTYEAIRSPATFADSREKLRRLKEKRDAAGVCRPQIRVCTIWPAVRDNPLAYQEALSPVSDYMVCNPYINFRGPMTLKPGFICQYPWERIVVGWDGKVQCCTGWNAHDIILGNAAEGTIDAFWKSEKMESIRRLHAQGRRLELNSCAECRHGSRGDPEISISEILNRRY